MPPMANTGEPPDGMDGNLAGAGRVAAPKRVAQVRPVTPVRRRDGGASESGRCSDRPSGISPLELYDSVTTDWLGDSHITDTSSILSRI